MKTKKIQKKAQIETMGLLVVVILVSLIIFFVLSFTLKSKDTTNQKQEFKELQAVSNFGTTMLETTDPCGKTIREVLTDCAFTKQMNCQGNDSCKTAANTMNQILNLTLDKWGYEYNLSVNNPQGAIVVSIATGCNDSLNSQKEITPFGTTYGSMSLVLKTCK